MSHRTIERIHPARNQSRAKYLLFLRHVFAYEYVTGRLPGDARVLEIGCGDGYGSHMLSHHVREVVALDVDAETIDRARRQYGSANCRFEHYEGDRLPFEAEAFEAVVSMQVIEHVEDVDRFISEANRVLRPGGTLWLTTPNRTHRIPPGGEIWNPFHLREYYPQQLEEVLSGVFDAVDVGAVSGTPAVREVEMRRVRRGLTLRKLIPEFVRGWMDRPARSRHSTADFHVSWEDGGRSGLDLIARCSKHPVVRPAN